MYRPSKSVHYIDPAISSNALPTNNPLDDGQLVWCMDITIACHDPYQFGNVYHSIGDKNVSGANAYPTL